MSVLDGFRETESDPFSPVVPLQLDHLVIAAESLKAGLDYIENLLQVPLERGGRHEKMGTHNALLRLDHNRYLEVIAIDKSLPAPQRQRWFSLDNAETIKQISEVPRLLHWVVRTADFQSLKFKVPASLGRIVSMSRGDLHWNITIPDDGSLPANGILPSIIQWITPIHPASLLPERSCSLLSLEAVLPNVDGVIGGLAEMGLQNIINLKPGKIPQLRATIETPSGVKIIT